LFCFAAHDTRSRIKAQKYALPSDCLAGLYRLFFPGFVRFFIIAGGFDRIPGVDRHAPGFLRVITYFGFPQMLVDTAVNDLSEFMVYELSSTHVEILPQFRTAPDPIYPHFFPK
jgi:hypothetical protein